MNDLGTTLAAAGALAISRVHQRVIPDWATRKKNKASDRYIVRGRRRGKGKR